MSRYELSEMHRAFIEDGNVLFIAVRPDGTCVFASPFLKDLLGIEPDDMVGRNVVELIHPGEVDRAAFHIGAAGDSSAGAGMARYKALHADGSYRWLEVMAKGLSVAGEPLVGLYIRDGIHPGVVIQQVLEMLLQGVPAAVALDPVCDIVQWQRLGSRVAVSWCDEAGFHQVGRRLPAELGGGDGARGTPWEHCRVDGVEVRGGLDDLDASRRHEAEAQGIAHYWIVPIAWSSKYPPATVTVWTVIGGPPPLVHVYGVDVLTSVVTLILRWTDQVRELGLAARSDSLTGLVNRRGFFDALQDSDRGGAVLFCDLDRFKPVNDEFGHAFGDDVLRLVARRLIASCRANDIVGRIGGDEFAVLCSGAEEAEAVEIAERIRAALEQPFDVGGDQVTIGTSIGVAVDAKEVSELLLGAADQALGIAKLDGGATVRVVDRRAQRPANASEHP